MLKPKEQVISASEFNRLRVHLAGKGMQSKDLDDVLGIASNSRDRQIIASTLIAWLQARPKG